MSTENRSPYWMSEKDITVIRRRCMLEEDNPTATAILTEVDVAKTRANSTPRLYRIGMALGYDKKTTPVHLSAVEVDYLLAWDDLPDRTRRRLT